MAAHGLDGSQARLPGGPLDDGEWSALRDEAGRQRVTGLLAAAVADGALPVTGGQDAEVRAAHVEAMARDLVLERLLLGVVATLDQAGLDHRVLKGPAVAHLDFPDPALRSFIDADVLVRSEQWDGAVAALVAAGHERQYPEPRPGWDRRFTKGTVLRTPSEHEIDLHRTFVSGPFGLTIDLDDMWRRHSVLSLGGRELRALALEERFLQACFSAAVSDVPPRVAPLRDVAQLGLSGHLDLDRLRRTTAAWGVEAVVHRAVELSWGAMGLGPLGRPERRGLAGWAGSLRPTRAQARALRAYTSPGDRYMSETLGALWAIRGAREKVAYVRALAFPDRSFVAPRYSGHLDRWRRGAKRLARDQ
ncbi:MAG: nucleotidyltransferase family protein [Acidimicrobiales bacterium]